MITARDFTGAAALEREMQRQAALSRLEEVCDGGQARKARQAVLETQI